MKLKTCSVCNKETYLWKSKPPSCKDCWLKIKAQEQSSEPKSYKVSKKKESRSYRIKSVSDKKLSELKEYRKKRDAFMKANKVCQFPECRELATDLHHKKSREYYLCDESIFMALCRAHHMWIHDNDKQAREMGLLLSSLSK